MIIGPVKAVSFEAIATSGYDGVIRLLADAERFGFALRHLSLSWPDDQMATIRFTLGVSEGVEHTAVADRFSRHPALSAVIALGVRDA